MGSVLYEGSGPILTVCMGLCTHMHEFVCVAMCKFIYGCNMLTVVIVEEGIL